jgi:hypothetical protein
MNFFLIIVDLGRIGIIRIGKKASRCDSRQNYLHFLIGMNAVWISIQEMNRGKIMARRNRFLNADCGLAIVHGGVTNEKCGQVP